MHGDELAGVNIIDTLRQRLCSGALNLRRNVIFVDGNLRAIEEAYNNPQSEPGAHRYFSEDKAAGVTANANREWLRELLEKAANESVYADGRRKKIWAALKSVLLGGSDTSEVSESFQHHDLHQSFSVPKIKDVRGEYHNDSEYGYGMVYAEMEFFQLRYSSVYAGLVYSDPMEAQTFAGATAREYGATAITAEIGTIGHTKEQTYEHKMLAALAAELEGREPEKNAVLPDVWKPVQTIIREDATARFGFYTTTERNGTPDRSIGGRNVVLSEDESGYTIGTKINPPTDFMPLPRSAYISNGEASGYLPSQTALLFANDNVVVGDRAGVVIKRSA